VQQAVAAEKKAEVTINMHMDPFGISRNQAVEAATQQQKLEQMKRAQERRMKEKEVSKQCRSEAHEWRTMIKATKAPVNAPKEEELEVEEIEEVESKKFKDQPESQERDTRVSKIFDKLQFRKTTTASAGIDQHRAQILALANQQQVQWQEGDGDEPKARSGGVHFGQTDETIGEKDLASKKSLLIASSFLDATQRIKPAGRLDDRIAALVKRQKVGKQKERNKKRFEARKARFLALPQSEQDSMRQAFSHYDADGSETLDMKELNSCLAELGLRGKNSEERSTVAQICQKLAQTIKAEEVLDPDEERKPDEPFEIDLYQLVVDLLPQIRERLGEQRRGALLHLFAQHDMSATGRLGVDECKNIAKGMDLPPSTIAQVFDEQCPNTEKLDFEVFQRLIGRLHEITDRIFRRKERIIKQEAKLDEQTFKKFRRELIPLYNSFQEWDADKSGCLDPVECCALMKEFGLLPRTPAEREELEAMVKKADPDENGLDFREFLDLISQIRRKCIDKNRIEWKGFFDKHDKDKSGQLSVAEVSAVLAELNLTPKTHEEQHEIRILIQDVDEDGSGELSFQEFQMLSQRVIERLMMLNLEASKGLALELGFSVNELRELRAVFDQLDTDGSNAIDISEARHALVLLKRDISSEQLRQVWTRIDVDGSDELDFAEFLRLMSVLNDKDSVLSAAKTRVETLNYVEIHTLQQILEVFKLGKDYVVSLSNDDLIQTCADCLGVSRADSLQQVLGVNTVEELLAVSRRRASMNIF
jgi:Ca2+-binding EF-hand superfamily protein